MLLHRRARIILLALALFWTQWSRPVHADDFGYWEFYTVRWIPAPKWEMDFFPELIYEKDGSQMSYLLLHAAAHYNPNSKLDIGFDYAYVRVHTDDDLFVTQHWLSPEVTYKQPVWSIPLYYRNKMEIREQNGATDRYRGRIGIDSPVALTPLQLTPYASYEAFYDFYRMAENQTRATFGIHIPIDARVLVNLFYLRQGVLGPTDWRHINYVGSDIRILIGPTN
jgi:hypothetical protein